MLVPPPASKQSVFTKTPHRLYNVPPTMRVRRRIRKSVCALLVTRKKCVCSARHEHFYVLVKTSDRTLYQGGRSAHGFAPPAAEVAQATRAATSQAEARSENVAMANRFQRDHR